MSTPGGGASSVFGPDGRQLVEPLDPTTEGIVYADINTDQAIFARSFLDVCGHYSRPDLLWLGCDTREREVRIEKAGAEGVE
jgi:nitrilase